MKRMIILFAMLFAFIFPMSACGGIQDKEGEIMIYASDWGHGVEYLYKTAEAFNKINPTITVKIKHVVSDNTSLESDISNTSSNPYDLYFSGTGDFKTQVDRGYLADLTDIYKESLSEVMLDDFEAMTVYKGKNYIVQWANGPSGLVYNTNYIPENIVPKTTNQLLQLCESIKTNKIATVPSGTAPFVWAGFNAQGYWTYLSDCWWAQYSTIEEYNKFWSLDNSSATGYSVYGDAGKLESWKTLEKLLDIGNGYSLYGSETKTHTAAQTNFMNGLSAMIPSGDWMENEMKEGYGDIHNYRMMKTPIISSLGTKLQIAGKDGTSEQHEEKLVQVIAAVDEGFSAEEIAASCAVTVGSARAVIDARKIVYNVGGGLQAYIPSYSNSISQAKLFLKFFASREGSEIFRKYAGSCLPFKYDITEEKITPFMESKDKILKDCVNLFYNTDASTLRYKAGILRYPVYDDFIMKLFTKEKTAQSMYQAQYDEVFNNWSYYYNKR